MFCSALSKTQELNGTIPFPPGSCWTRRQPVPTLEESTCIWKRYSVEGNDKRVSSELLVLISLKEFFLLVGPSKRSSIVDQLDKCLALNLDVSDKAAVKAKASKHFHYISFSLKRFQILQVFYSFCNWLNRLFGDNLAKETYFSQEEVSFV